MSWESVQAVAEVLGAFGVIASLAYLAVQIRQNTIATNKQSLRDAMEFISSANAALYTDSSLADIFNRGMEDYESLAPEEQTRFHYFCVTRVQSASAAIELQEGLDNLDALPSMDDWLSRVMSRPGFRQWWLSRGQSVVGVKYRKHIDNIRIKLDDD